MDISLEINTEEINFNMGQNNYNTTTTNTGEKYTTHRLLKAPLNTHFL
jgi:hypothetical protein